MARDVRVSFKISEEKHRELKAIADSYGVTMSSLSAFVIGQWLHQQNKLVQPMIETVKEVLADTIKEVSEGDGLGRQA